MRNFLLIALVAGETDHFQNYATKEYTNLYKFLMTETMMPTAVVSSLTSYWRPSLVRASLDMRECKVGHEYYVTTLA